MLFDVPERPIEIQGPDSEALLDRVFARPISDLKVNRARYAIACLHNGGILMDGVLIRLAQDHFWYVQADGEFTLWLQANAESLDVQISDPKSWVLQVQGPRSLDVLEAVAESGLPGKLGYFHTAMVQMGGQELLIFRTGWTGELGFEIYTQGPETDAPRLWDHLMEKGGEFGLTFSSLESGILDNGTDMDPSMTPFEAGLGAFVDLEKSGFVGREALLSADKNTLLYGLKCSDDVPFTGLNIFEANSKVGRMTAGAWSPSIGAGIGYVRFSEAGEWMGRKLTLEARDGVRHSCEIVQLPFYDEKKEIARGIDRTIPLRNPEEQ